LALKKNRGNLGGTLWNLNAIYVLSKFMRKQYIEVHGGVCEQACFVTRNGIHLPDFAELQPVPRDLKKLVYASRPERGLENCLAIMQILERRGSNLRLEVSGYDNTPPQMEAFYQMLWGQAQQMPNIKLIGAQKQTDWYGQLASAQALIYPAVENEFREISCLLAMEAQACGTPIVSCKRGALPETINRKAAVFLGDEETNVHSEEYREKFADAIESVTRDEVAWRRMSKAGRRHAQSLGWDGVAQQWEEHWIKLITEQNSDRYRSLRHMVRMGDWELFNAEKPCQSL
jgi:glycosyltransferase involved in cell wall biosynthesis